MNKPYYRQSEGVDKGVYVRIGRSTMRASFEMIEELRWQSRGLSYDIMPIHRAKEEDLDKSKILEFLKNRRNKAAGLVTHGILKNYKLNLFLSNATLSVSDIITSLHLARSTTSRYLSELVAEKKLLKKGSGRGTRYFRG